MSSQLKRRLPRPCDAADTIGTLGTRGDRSLAAMDVSLRDAVKACSKGDVHKATAAIDKYLAEGGSINVAFSAWLGSGDGKTLMNNVTMLMMASYKGRAAVVDMLIARGADVHAKNDEGDDAVTFAALKGHRDVVARLLMAGADITSEARQCEGVGGLYREATLGDALMACGEGDVQKATDALNKYLAEGGNINAGLNVRVGSGDDKALLKDVTMLMIASAKGVAGVVDMLIARGADVNAKNSEGHDAVSVAALEGHRVIVAQLIMAGATITNEVTRMCEGLCGLHCEANDNSRALEAANSGDTAAVTKFLNGGGDINARSTIKLRATGTCLPDVTMLMAASAQGHMHVVNMLIARGADVNAQDGSGTHTHGSNRRPLPTALYCCEQAVD